MDENKIILFLKGKLFGEERQELISWLKADENNFNEYKAIKQAWALSSGLSPNVALDPEAEFETFKRKNFGPEESLKPRQHFTINFLKIAGIFIFAFGLSFVANRLLFIHPYTRAVAMTEITTRAGEKSQITLPDGSQIWVNACTKLKYPSNMTAANIEFFLDGEAYFDLKKIPNRKITVHTSQLNIKVLGTAFNLKAYKEEKVIETTLVRGQIAIENNDGNTTRGNQVMLEPNQTAVFFKDDKGKKIKLVESRIAKTDNSADLTPFVQKQQSNIVVVEKINPETPTSWKDGKLSFTREHFERLAILMERWFNKKIEIKGEKLRNVRFSGTFDKETIEQALDALSYPVPFKYTIRKDSVFIYPK